jgi:hypothetical protein
MLMPSVDHPTLLAGAAAVVGGAALINAAVVLVAIGAMLGVFAFAVWFRNRDNLRALDELLRDKARVGMTALKEVDGV